MNDSTSNKIIAVFFLSYLDLSLRIVNKNCQYFISLPAVTGVMHKAADDAYSIRSTWSCKRVD